VFVTMCYKRREDISRFYEYKTEANTKAG
jgi:hypothetical protein